MQIHIELKSHVKGFILSEIKISCFTNVNHITMAGDPRVWGNDLWKTMHRFSLAYPRNNPSLETQKAARNFYESIKYLLPCPHCAPHYCAHFDKTFTDETVKSRKNLVKWVFDFHNAVNKRLGKPIPPITVDDLPRLYNSFPLRFVDMQTGNLLEKARYDTVEGRDSPEDEEALKALQKRLKDASEKNGKEKSTNEKENNTKNDTSHPEIANSVLADKIPSPSSSSSFSTSSSSSSTSSSLVGTASLSAAERQAEEKEAAAREAAAKTSFWNSPGGIAVVCLIALAALLLIVAIVLFVASRRQPHVPKTALVRASNVAETTPQSVSNI